MRVVGLLVFLCVLALPVLAQDQPAPNPPMNPGMSCPMPGMGMGQGMGRGMGQGMGPGMGQGMGPGMGQGMGQGMMCPMCPMMGAGGMLPGHMFNMHAAALELTEDQIQKIQNIQTDFRRQQIRTGSEIELSRIDLQQEMMKDNPDVTKAERLIRDINRLQADMQVAAMKASAAAKNVLTPEQRSRAKSMMMRPPMGGGMQPMPPAGGPHGPMPMQQ